MFESASRATLHRSFSRLSRPIRSLLILLTLMCSQAVSAVVFINEIHYDNTGGDTGEAIEVAGTAGEDLTGWTIVLYNGSNNSVYSTINLAGTIPNQQNGFGTLSFLKSGIQNGSPDGMALVDDTATVIQFLSYEGDFTAAGGAADTMMSVDIGVSEASGSAVGNSLQLGGTGEAYADFAWQGSQTSTFGAVNTGQTFGTPIESAPEVLSTTPADTATGVAPDANIEVVFNEDVNVTATWFDITCASSAGHTAASAGGPTTFTLDPDADFDEGELCTVTVDKNEVTDDDSDDPPDNMAADYVFTFTTLSSADDTPLIINEVDADQSGSDSAEFVELFDGGAGNTALDGLVVVLFNGGGDVAYEAWDLDGQTTNADGYFVLCGNPGNVPNCDLDVGAASNLIQNGADAVALYQDDASSFGDGTAVTTNLLIDAMVYDTNDSDDAGLLPLLNPGQPQLNEDGGDDSTVDSNQRCPNGVGGTRNTSSYEQANPTPGAVNECIVPLINEVDADQSGSDAAEFIEIFTPGISNFPLDGYSIVLFNGSDDASYQSYDLDGESTDADGYFVLCGTPGNVPNCDMDVSPNGNLIQNGAEAVGLFYGDAVDFPNDTPVTTENLVDALVHDVSDPDDAALLVLLIPGQPQVDENGNGSKDTHSNQRCPNGFGGARNTDTYDQATPTPGVTNNCGPLEIWEIQGAGDASAYDGFDVLTADNIVTAVGPDGFAMQTPTARDDADIDTSNGIYVFTGGAPGVAVGDQVDVSGQVDEFFDFTEFTSDPVVTIDSSGNPLPSAVAFGASVPSPDPTAPSCAIEYECYEGMLVEVIDGAVTAGNLYFGSDPIAEASITAASTRTYREPGVIYPGLGAPIPTWDGNPEVFELDPDRLGLSNSIIPGGSAYTATGIIGYEFGDYELWPTSLLVSNATLPVPVREKAAGEITVGSFNLFRYAEDTGGYATRLEKLSIYIRTVLNAPDVLAVQEATDIAALQDLADRISSDDAGVVYTAYLVEGNDFGGIDVGFLVRGDNLTVEGITQFEANAMFTFDNPDSFLHDRPPLMLEARFTAKGNNFPIAVLNVHIRSLNGIESERVQRKRLEQAESIAGVVQSFQAANPGIPLMVVGDFNAFQFTDGYADVIGHIKGSFNPVESERSGADLVSPNLTNQVDLIPAGQRYSFVFRGNAQTLDHALTSVSTNDWVRGLEYGRGNSDAAVDQIRDQGTAIRSSDHDGFVLFLMTDRDRDGVADDLDDCPMNPVRSTFDPEYGCDPIIPTLDWAGLLLMLTLLAGMGAYTIRRRGQVRA